MGWVGRWCGGVRVGWYGCVCGGASETASGPRFLSHDSLKIFFGVMVAKVPICDLSQCCHQHTHIVRLLVCLWLTA